MSKKPAMGKDPFEKRMSWIKSTKLEEEQNENNINIDLQSIQELQSNHELQDNYELQDNIDLHEKDVTPKKIKNRVQQEKEVQLTENKYIKANENKKTNIMGLKPGWTRGTFILMEDHLEKLKALAYFEREDIKDTLSEMFETFFEKNKKRVDEAVALYKKRKK